MITFASDIPLDKLLSSVAISCGFLTICGLPCAHSLVLNSSFLMRPGYFHLYIKPVAESVSCFLEDINFHVFYLC